MKNLLIMRHAKSDWENNLPDIERPLNKRGKKAAPFMAKYLSSKGKIPDLIMSSPAKRALDTANYVKEILGLNYEIKIVKDFYFGYMTEIVNAIKNIDNKHNTVLILGHNPLWEDLAARFSKDDEYLVMPTAAIASLLFDTDNWKDIDFGQGILEWLVTPKGLK